jgi:large subunit ribosomal protein L24
MKIRKNDLVVVISGNNAEPGKAKRVLRTLPSKGTLVVEGVNKVYKHVKPNRRNMQGGRLSKEMPIDASNVMLYCASCRKGVRTGVKIEKDATKYLACKKCNGNIRVIARPKTARVQG